MKPRYKVKQHGNIYECSKVGTINYNKELIEACKMPAHSFSENEIRRMLCTIAFGLGACVGSVIGSLL